MHIFRPWQYMCRVSKRSRYNYREEMRLQNTQCIYALNQKWLSSNCEKSDKINLRITAKCHAHLQILGKRMQSFFFLKKKICLNCKRSWVYNIVSVYMPKVKKFKLQKKWKNIIWGLQPNVMQIFKPWQNTWKVKKRTSLNCKRSFYVFSILCLLCLCARLFIRALWTPAGKGLTSWLSFVV